MKKKQKGLIRGLITGLIILIGLGSLTFDVPDKMNQQKVLEAYPRLESMHNLGAKFHPIKIFFGIVDTGVWSKFIAEDCYVIIKTYDNEWGALTNRNSVKGTIHKEAQTYQDVSFTLEVGFLTDIDEPQSLIVSVKLKHDGKVTTLVLFPDASRPKYAQGSTLREEDRVWMLEFIHNFIDQP